VLTESTAPDRDPKGRLPLVQNDTTGPVTPPLVTNSTSPPTVGLSPTAKALRAAQVIVISSVTFTFISYWRTAAVVLCDLASTAYYIGAIVENSIGKAAPWFILGVLVFSYGMRAVYIESSALFVRGGVYRVVKEALGGFVAKLSVSALLFDYILTGPISGVSAGQYIVGLGLDAATSRYFGVHLERSTFEAIQNWGAVIIACATTLYFFRQNLLGMHESSDKALKIMIAMTVMGLVILVWAAVTLANRGAVNPIPTWRPDLNPKINASTGTLEDPLGFIGYFPSIAGPLRHASSWLSIVGLLGVVFAFGHSILAMSGEETLAQVYREVESPKLPNFKKAAFIVFVYSLLLTGTVSFLAVMMIPDTLRMTKYQDNLLGGLAMQMAGPLTARLLLNGFVVVVGFLILSGAVNTSIIGSNGVLNRVAEDGVLPDWFLKPHHRFGTTSRVLWLITILQLFTIVVSRGNVILLGEAYAFGVVWSFAFKTLSMMVLRFKDHTPRAFRVPLNFHIGKVEIPVGLGIIFLIVFCSALANLLTKEVATVSGLAFTGAFLTVFVVTEYANERRRRGAKHTHLEQFNQQVVSEIKATELGLMKPYRKLVAIRSPHNLFMLEKALAESDPNTTDVVVMTAKVQIPGGETGTSGLDLDNYDQQLMTAVVERAERAGKKVKPLIVPTNSPLHAILRTAKDLQAQEVVVGASNKFTAEEQLDQISFYWISLHDGRPPGLTVRILSRDRDVYFDVEGGNRIPKIGERQARSVADLRAAGIGVDKVLLVHDGLPASSDLFQSVLTMLDAKVILDLAAVKPIETPPPQLEGVLQRERERARTLGREIKVHALDGHFGPELVRLAREGHYELIIVALPQERPAEKGRLWGPDTDYVLAHAHCPIFLAAAPVIPAEVAD
jgi:amino acid transporter/nucleotide-binding universal stress UspA family protein